MVSDSGTEQDLQTVWGIGYRLNPNPMTTPVTPQTFGPDTAAFAQQRTVADDA